MTDLDTASGHDQRFAPMLITLHKGVLYRDQNPQYWQALLDF